jgi:DNA polymerase-3 subunit delta'
MLPFERVSADLRARGLEPERAELLAHLSGGRPGWARRLAEQPELLQERQERLNDLQTLLPASRTARFAYAERIAREKEKLPGAVQIWLSYWRDVLLQSVNAAPTPSPITNLDRQAEIDELAALLGWQASTRVVRRHERALEQLGRNVNARLLLEVLLLDLPRTTAGAQR